jgi:hypothetical protein
MKVITVKPAFYLGSRVRVGTELEVPDDMKGSWFEQVPESAAEPEVVVAKRKRSTPRSLSQMTHEPKQTFVDVYDNPDLA